MHSPVLAASILFCVLSFLALPADAAAAGPCDRPILRAEGRMSGWALAPAYKQMIARRLSLRKWEETSAELHGADYARKRQRPHSRLRAPSRPPVVARSRFVRGRRDPLRDHLEVRSLALSGSA